jgi:hypothetical protein
MAITKESKKATRGKKSKKKRAPIPFYSQYLKV